MVALAKTKQEAILIDSICDIHGGILPDNFREYHYSHTYPLQSDKPASTFPYDPFVHSIAFNQLAIDLLVRNQASFYHQTIMNLDALTEILHSQKHCCASISIESYSPTKYSQARQHLDDKIALLQWIVGQFILVPCTHLNRQHQVCVARFDGYPYEDLLARAYNRRIIQIADHPEDCVYPCCKHCIRPDFARDTVYPSHWYHWTGPQKDIPLHWSEQEHDQLLNSPAEYMDAMTTAIHIMYTFIDRTCQLPQSVRTPIDILKQQVQMKVDIVSY